MATPEVSIDYEAVGALALTFAQSAQQFQLVSAIIRSLSYTVRALSFTNSALIPLAEYFVLLGQKCDQLAAKCTEYAADLDASIKALQNGDTSGAARFAQ